MRSGRAVLDTRLPRLTRIASPTRMRPRISVVLEDRGNTKRVISAVRKRSFMTRFWMVSILIGLVLAISLAGCGSSESGEAGDNSENGEHSSGSESGEGGDDSESGEHSSESESGEDDGEEESGTQFALNETFDEVRAGARLILQYDSTANAFVGTVENTTETTLARVRVEVHLSNGIELGPTTPVNLAPGQISDINLPAGDQSFTSWSAHPEVG